MELDFKYNGTVIRLIRNHFRDSFMFVVIKHTASTKDSKIKRYVLANTKWIQIAEGQEFPVYYGITTSTELTLDLLIHTLKQIKKDIDQCPFHL